MAEKSYNYECKQKARSVLKNLIKRNIKTPEKSKVLFFPGEEALEIFEIYDKLRIPRQNLFGIECDEKIFEKIKRKSLGINLFNLTDTEYLANTKEKFDIINLDYKGEFNDNTNLPRALITKRQLLKSRGILGTSFYCRREKREIKENYAQPLTIGVHEDFEKWENDREKIFPLSDSSIESIFDKKIWKNREKKDQENLDQISATRYFSEKGVSLDKVRDKGITNSIILGMRGGRDTILQLYFNCSNELIKTIPKEDVLQFIPKIIQLDPNFNIISNNIGKEYLNSFLNNVKKTLGELNNAYKKYPDKREKILEMIRKQEDLINNSAKNNEQNFYFGNFSSNRHLESIISQVGNENETFIRLLYENEIGRYFPIFIKRFKYLSDVGSPMYVDYIVFDQFKDLFEELLKYGKLEIKEGKMSVVTKEFDSLTELNKEKNRLEKTLDILDNKISSEESQRLIKPREFLGNSFKSKYKPEIVARELIEGKSEEEIHKECRISNNELGAVKAWITMGKYDYIKKEIEEKNKPKVQEIKQEEPTLESKVLSIYTDILSGLSDEKIKEKHGLENMTLAGYKAAIKRGGRESLVNKAVSAALSLDKENIIENIYSKIKVKGIGYLSNGSDMSKEVLNLQKEQLNVSELNGIEDKGLYILSANNGYSNESLKKIEDICLSSDKLNPPAILVISNSSQIKDKLRVSVSTLKELGIISRIFCYNSSNNQLRSLNEILGESYLVR